MNRDVSTRQLAHPFARVHELVTHSLALHCLLVHSAALINTLTHSQACQNLNDLMSQNQAVLNHSAAVRKWAGFIRACLENSLGWNPLWKGRKGWCYLILTGRCHSTPSSFQSYDGIMAADIFHLCKYPHLC